jgi:hypothetical protein
MAMANFPRHPFQIDRSQRRNHPNLKRLTSTISCINRSPVNRGTALSFPLKSFLDRLKSLLDRLKSLLDRLKSLLVRLKLR